MNSSTARRPRFAIPLARVAAELARTPRTLAPLLAVFSRTCHGARCCSRSEAAPRKTCESVASHLKVSKKYIQFGSLFLLHKIFFLQTAKAKKMERQPKLNSWIFIPFFQNTLLFSPCGQWANPLLVGALRSRGKKQVRGRRKNRKKSSSDVASEYPWLRFQMMFRRPWVDGTSLA